MTRKASSMAMRRWLRKVRRNLANARSKAARQREATRARWARLREGRS